MVSSTRNVGASPDQSASKPTRILAIDYGLRRIGLAISDELGLTAHPLGTIERKNRRLDLRRLRDLARKNQVGAVLIGSPLHLNGRAGEMAEEAARFAERIREELRLPVELRDERLTSWEAKEMAAEFDLRKNADIDSLAAAILLREYLNEPKNPKKSKHPVHE
jgi:putative holliday junction resolvase